MNETSRKNPPTPTGYKMIASGHRPWNDEYLFNPTLKGWQKNFLPPLQGDKYN